jgi:hypothetical protein
MKIGTLVKLKHTHISPTVYKKVGLVMDYFPTDGYLEECVLVAWSSGSAEIEFPHWLEVINEVR